MAMTELPLTGGCNCGAVRYEVTAPLLKASYCHCKRCQRRTGTAVSASAHPAEGTFRIVAGEDRLRSLIASARGPEGLAHALDKALGTAWDAELEPYRYAGDGAPVTWLTQVG